MASKEAERRARAKVVNRGMPSIPAEVAAKLGDEDQRASVADINTMYEALDAFYEAAAAERRASVVSAGSWFEEEEED